MEAFVIAAPNREIKEVKSKKPNLKKRIIKGDHVDIAAKPK